MGSSENIANQLSLNDIKFNNRIKVLKVHFTRDRRMNTAAIGTGRKQIRWNDVLQFKWTNSLGNSSRGSLLDVVSTEKQHIIHCLVSFSLGLDTLKRLNPISALTLTWSSQ